MELKQLLKLLVETESPSHDKAAVDRVGGLVAAEARKLGAQVDVIPNQGTGNHILARFTSDLRPVALNLQPILLLCHMDTVFPLGTIQKTPYREEGDKIFGPGALLDGSLKTWRKGVGGFEIKVKGRAAHSGGDHQAGRNAIEEMAHLVLAIQKLTDYSKQTTVNVGVIHGGTVSNVVPEEARIEVDVRVMQPGEWERVEAEVQNLKPALDGTSIEITGSLNRPPMPFDERMKSTFEKARSIAAKIDMNLTSGGTGGASDGNFVAPLGIPVLDGMGAVGEGYHSEREYIFIASMVQKAKLIAELIRAW